MRRLLARIGGLETLIVLTLFVVASVGWWHAWIAPNDAHIHAVMACVEDEGSYVGDPEVWNRCHDRLVVSAGGLVPVFSPATN
tara:strand:+ start:7082 stop:7330 length:249 start_codon:yes stop_codon:yes gene_type:complete